MIPFATTRFCGFLSSLVLVVAVSASAAPPKVITVAGGYVGNGTPAKEAGLDQLTSVAVDAKGNIYVADRDNSRIQVFDNNGTFLRIIKIDVPAPPDARVWMGNAFTAKNPPQTSRIPGSPWAVCITPGPGTQYLYSSDNYPGRVYKLTLDGKVVGMLGSTGRQPKQFGWIHQMACPSENELYVAEILNWRVQKLLLHPGNSSR